MAGRTRDPQRTKAAILKAARHLLAEKDFADVSIRDVAEQAGVSHGLVQHHFGTREQLIAAIIHQEIADFVTSPIVATPADRDRLGQELRTGLDQFADFARLITRATLAGVHPEAMLAQEDVTPALLLADAIRTRQLASGTDGPDPAIVAAYVNAATFAFATLGPWLMVSVGLRPEDLDAHSEEIAELSMSLIGLAVGDGAPQD